MSNEPPLLLDLLSIERNSIRLGGPTQGIVTKTIHKTLLGGGGGSLISEVKSSH